ncbi:E3 ubiquitin-protein ligase AMFR [Lingula anatina]|uniref:E3 ubiquitin-protein ligase AMFR n=1 Tax=Lingula anatina TaxID=7574 RepID=A0A1S3H2I5_LINAN|nr:E3 ubiquitin-protein ligase AMFR [Lingula anatina]|eukprot:XP_013379354.1 E3 ubiquitin-protein ligase AMFR [Lingula anatina]
MPVIFLERIPLPSLQTYSAVTFVLLSIALLYGHRKVVEHLPEEIHVSDDGGAVGSPMPEVPTEEPRVDTSFDPNAFHQEYHGDYAHNMVTALLDESWCVWILINVAYCILILIGKLIQLGVFGNLRISEQEHLKDKFWNFIFYKFIFIFGIMNVQTMDEVFRWCGWFSILCFLQLLAQLSKDRFEYLSFSLSTPRWTHAKVIILLSVILGACFGLLALSILVGLESGLHVFSFMAAECALLGISVVYVLIRYAIHLWDIHHDGVWEQRSSYAYYTELVCELLSLGIDFLHHLHMLLWSNIFLSMASLVICMQLRYLFHEFQRRVKRHKNYQRVVKTMQTRFPIASAEQLQANDDKCAICWEKMKSGRTLPCGHIFHSFCLRSWLEQDVSCPTCREALNFDEHRETAEQGNIGAAGDAANAPAPPRNINQTTNHFFHFDGSRYVRWLPSFSVEVTHTTLMDRNLLARQRQHVQTSQMDTWVRQVREVFPDTILPDAIIQDDLHITRSPEMTVNNILEGRLPIANSIAGNNNNNPAVYDSDDSYSTASSVSEDVAHNYRDDNVPALFEIPDVEEDVGAAAVNPGGGRYSKKSSEREELLNRRREELIEQARRRFQSKEASTSTEQASPSDLEEPLSNTPPEASLEVSENLLRQRRQQAYDAAIRRMMQHEPQQ